MFSRSTVRCIVRSSIWLCNRLVMAFISIPSNTGRLLTLLARETGPQMAHYHIVFF